jgi:cysteine-rich repeat protein
VACSLTPAITVSCDSCTAGYGISNNNCIPICGDGMIVVGENCDDGNSASFDGCNPICSVESNFICNGTTATGASECYLLSLTLDKVSTFKDQTKNSLVMNFDIKPKGLESLYNNVDWSKIISINPASEAGNSTTISSIKFNPDTQLLEVTMDYTDDIDEKEIDLKFDYTALTAAAAASNSTNPNMFSLLTTSTYNTTLKADNNLQLDYYPPEVYQLAAISKLASAGLSAAALGTSFLALLGAKLVGLEMIAVFQMSYLSLLAVDNMNPILDSLSALRFSCGYNKMEDYNKQQNIGREFKAL